MSNPLTFLRPLRYDLTRSVMLVQTGPAEHLSEIVKRLRKQFLGCRVEVLMREGDAAPAAVIGADRVEVARYEERYELLSRLRKRRFDVVAMQATYEGNRELRALPFLLRTRAIIAFNDNLDYFPFNVFRLGAVVEHLGGEGDNGLTGPFLWLVRQACVELVVAPLALAYLLVVTAWLHVRGATRRAVRARGPGVG